MNRGLVWTSLALLLTLVVLLAADYLSEYPFPPRSQHRAFVLVPRLMHNMMGYSTRDDMDNMDTGEYSYATGERETIPWTQPSLLLREFRTDGRLEGLFGRCTAVFYTCWPHSWALHAATATRFPGRPLLVSLTNTGYFLLLLLALYGVGAELGGRQMGLLSAVLAAGYPGLFGFSRWIEGYLPVTALTVAMLYFLLKTKGFTRIWATLAFALCAATTIRSGEGLSEAIGAGLTISGPFVWQASIAIRNWGQQKDSSRIALCFLILALVLGFSTNFRWVIAGMDHILEGFSDHEAAPILAGLRGFREAPSYLTHGLYLLFIFYEYLKPPLTLLLLIALPFFFRSESRHKYLILLWFIIPFLAYSAIERKSLWYALPIVPPLALMTSIGLLSIQKERLRRTLVVSASGIAMVQLIWFSSPELNRILEPPRAWALPDGIQGIDVRQPRLIVPGNNDLAALRVQADEFIRYLNETVPYDDELKYVAVLSDDNENYQAQALWYYLSLSRPDFEVIALRWELDSDRLPHLEGLDEGAFSYYIRLGSDRILPCCDESGPIVIPARQLEPPNPKLVALAHRILEGYAGEISDELPIVRLEPPDGRRDKEENAGLD